MRYCLEIVRWCRDVLRYAIDSDSAVPSEPGITNRRLDLYFNGCIKVEAERKVIAKNEVAIQIVIRSSSVDLPSRSPVNA